MPSVVFGRGQIAPRFGNPEVRNEDSAVRRQQDVGGLDVAMDDPAAMRGVERVSDLGEDHNGLPRFERAVLVEVLAQRRPVHELHDDRLDVAVGAGVEDRHDPRMREPGRGHRLAPEPLDERVVGGEMRMQQLHRHLAGEGLVSGLPDLRHAAGGDEAVEAVPTPDESTGERIE